ncbi:hypothetical protein GCM10009662_68260 [Catellatospora coxensis]|uniref:Uncharacterized protein n=1 Tax=Catellatospora coxensis TaxID=310354 RepID=A0A8J3P7U0_9ACTN|nr:hypothetical protein Cco03nite_34080 [Catellatospora coxensis]
MDQAARGGGYGVTPGPAFVAGGDGAVAGWMDQYGMGTSRGGESGSL